MKIAIVKVASRHVVIQKTGIMPLSAIAAGDVDHFYRIVVSSCPGTFLVRERGARRTPCGGRIIVFSRRALRRSSPPRVTHIAAQTGVAGLIRRLGSPS